MAKKLFTDYGMVVVLFGLCVLLSILTLKEQTPTGKAAIKQVMSKINSGFEKTDFILAVGAKNKDSAPFAEELGQVLTSAGYVNARAVVGEPKDLRQALDQIKAEGGKLSAIAASGDVTKWTVIDNITTIYPEFDSATGAIPVIQPKSYMWPDFLKKSNLLAIVDRIVVIAVIAIGMTMVIITGGIDLSVGSLIALSAVIAALVMKALGGLTAPAWTVAVGFMAGTLCTGAIGAAGGFLVARFKVAPFITTLGVMMMARGFAFILSGGFSIYQVPKALPWLGQQHTMGVPNTVILLVVLYAAAHIFMTYTRLGRCIYATGGNENSARLSGVSVGWVIFFVYFVSALAAGLGGCIQASQINTGTPNMGQMYELYVIAAVVVGGTSLSGGSGRILGTLTGAFVISVIQNGMNLLGMESYTQQVVLGAVILGAVLLDKARTGGEWPAFIKKMQLGGNKREALETK